MSETATLRTPAVSEGWQGAGSLHLPTADRANEEQPYLIVLKMSRNVQVRKQTTERALRPGSIMLLRQRLTRETSASRMRRRQRRARRALRKRPNSAHAAPSLSWTHSSNEFCEHSLVNPRTSKAERGL